MKTYDCPACNRNYKIKHAQQTHIGRAHPEYIKSNPKKVVTIYLNTKVYEDLKERGMISKEIRSSLKKFIKREGNNLIKVLNTKNNAKKTFSVNLCKKNMDYLNFLTSNHMFPSRLEAIRFIIVHQKLNELNEK